MTAIEPDGVHFRYPGGVEAVRGVSLLSPRASGWRSWARTARGRRPSSGTNGILRPTSGRVLLDGEPTEGRTIAQLAAQVGYVFQNPDEQLFASTVRADVEFGPRNLGCSPEEASARVASALATVRLWARRTPTRTTSRPASASGWRWPVPAMRTLAVVLDEPTTGQDA